MKTISNESMKPAIEAIRTNFEAISELKKKAADMSLSEAAQMHLMDALGYTQLQAQEVIDELMKGLEQYAAQRQTMETDADALPQSIKKCLNAYSGQERIQILANILTAFQAGDAANTEENLKALATKNAALTEDELVEAVTAALDGMPFASAMDTVGKELDKDTLVALGNMRELMTDDYKLSAAIFLYVAQQQGTMNFGNDGAPLPPEMIGAMTGASIDALNATDDLQHNRIDLKTWQRILKFILGALFVVALYLLAAVALIAVNLGLAYVITSIFGIGLLSTVLTVAGAIVLCFSCCELFDETMDSTIEKLSDVYDKVIVKLTEWANALRAKVEALLNRNETAAQANTQTVNTNSPECDNNLSVQTAGTAPAMA